MTQMHPSQVSVRRYLSQILCRAVRLKLELKVALLLFATLLISLDADSMFAAIAETEEHGLPQKAVEIARPFGFPITNSMVVSWIVAVGLIIDEAKAEEARQRAEARLREKLSDEQVASVNALLTRSLAQLCVKRRRRV